ncbi:MAG: M15 family metallopeptidase [Nocardioidaceae bacterium]
MTWLAVAVAVPLVIALAPAQAVAPPPVPTDGIETPVEPSPAEAPPNPPAASPSTEPERAEGAVADVPAAVRESMQRHREELKESGVRDLGWQLSDPMMVGEGAQWQLSNGTVYWLAGLGSKAVWSRHLKKYVAFGGPRGELGFPVSDVEAARVSGATRSRYQDGRIYDSSRTGTHEIHGPIATRFVALGAELKFGLPVTDEGGGGLGATRASSLQKGRIYWHPTTGAVGLWGRTLSKYISKGGARAWFGLPTREQRLVGNTYRADFARAAIVTSRSTWAVRVIAPYSATSYSVTRTSLGRTYRSGCPVGPSSLRRLRLVYRDWYGDATAGDLVVHRNVVGDIRRVFEDAHEAKFNVRRIRPMSAYGGDDIRAMEDDNTSAFNCRKVTGNPYRLSQHSYGNAIDINTFENPYVTSSRVYPEGSETYLNRGNYRKGMLMSWNSIPRRMRAEGWPWGARWSNPDYQHFSSNGG